MQRAPPASELQRAPRVVGELPGAGPRPNNYTTQFVVDGAGHVQRQEAVETDPHRIAQRQKQIDYGKNTLGYQRYTEEVPRYLRRKISTKVPKHPDTPDVCQICSKRSFDGQAKKWRRELHLWDPEDEDDLLEPVLQNLAQAAAEQPDPAQDAAPDQHAEQQGMAEGVGSPEASAEAAAFSLPNSRSPPGSLSHPVEEEAGPSSFLSPKKQKTDTGHARPMPPRHEGSIVGENVLPSEVPRKPLSTGSKRSYQDMDTETTSSGQAFPERNHAKTEANDTNEESHKSVSAVNKQSDDIYGPAYEFD